MLSGQALFNRHLGPRTKWYGGIAVVLGAALISLMWEPLIQRFYQASVPLEEVLWTATPDYKIFFGPGTTPSAELAAKLRGLQAEYSVSEDAFRFPNSPLFISPRILMAEGSSSDIVICKPFTTASAELIRSDYLRRKETTNR